MSQYTTDSQSPGRIKVQEYGIGGGISASKANGLTSPLDFLILKNAIIDKRVGAVLKRPGSSTEVISGTLGFPNGFGEYEAPAMDAVLPTNRSLLAFFGGSEFREQSAGTWSTVTATSYVNFSTSRQYQCAKIGDNMFIAGGRPAKWGGPGTQIDRMGIKLERISTLAPRVLSKNLPGPGLTWTVGASYMFTLYDSTTGLESDWSFVYASVGATTDSSVSLSLPAMTQENWDSIRLYRTLDGGRDLFYLVTTLPAGTLSYIDNTPDEDLTEQSQYLGDNAVPPENAFVMELYANRLWMVDPTNPYKVVYSKPYVGSDVDLEYFPVDNYVMSNQPVTALKAVPGKMLFFHPRDISYLTGGSPDDFAYAPWTTGVGTVFPHSVSTNGSEIFFLAEQGAVSISFSAGAPRHISREIDLDLQPILAASYNNSLYVASCWNTSLRQFIFLVSAQGSAGAPWEEVGTGDTSDAVAGWEDSVSFATALWEDIANPSATDVMKIKIWGWSPELSGEQNIWMEYEFPGILNNNVNGNYPVSLFHPKPSADTGDPQQDKTYLSVWESGHGEVRSIFRRDKGQDDSTDITSEVLTGRIKPGLEGNGYKLFCGLGFINSYSDPTTDSLGVLKYLIDYDDPHLRSYSGQLIAFGTQAKDIKKMPTMLGRHIHLHVVDTSSSLSKILLTNFDIHYRERLRRQGR